MGGQRVRAVAVLRSGGWETLFSALLNGFVLIARPWRSPDTKLGSVLFVLNNAAIATALWVTSGFYARSDIIWVPFQANKLGALAVALLSPPLWAGLASIAGFVGTAVLKLQLFDPVIRQHIAFGEPWIVLIYGAFGVVLLLYRLPSIAREREVVRAQMESAAARKSARLLLAVRDQSNTPLQVIAISSAILRARGPGQLTAHGIAPLCALGEGIAASR